MPRCKSCGEQIRLVSGNPHRCPPSAQRALKPIGQQVINILSVRYDTYGKIKLMAQADGYVMCRRPGKMPFVMGFSEWLKMPEQPVT